MISATQTILFSTSLMLLSSLLRIAAADEQPPRIAIADFTTEENSYRAELAAVDFSTALQALLANEPGIEWVERAQLAAVEKEHDLPALGFADPDRSLKLGKWAKADLMLTGWFHDKTATNQYLRLEVIDLGRAELLATTDLELSVVRLESPSQVNAQVLGVAERSRQMIRESTTTWHVRALGRSAMVFYIDYFGRAGGVPLSAQPRQTNQWTEPLRRGIEDTLVTEHRYRLVNLARAGDAFEESTLFVTGLVGDVGESRYNPADLYVWGGFTTHENYRFDPVRRTNVTDHFLTFDLRLCSGSGVPTQLTNVISVNEPELEFVRQVKTLVGQALLLQSRPSNGGPEDPSPAKLIFETYQWQHPEIFYTWSDDPEYKLRIRDRLAFYEMTLLVDPNLQAVNEEWLFLRWGPKSPSFHSPSAERDRFRRLWKASEAWGQHVDRYGLETVGKHSTITGLAEGQARESHLVAPNYLLYPQQLIEILNSFQAADRGVPRDIDHRTLLQWRSHWAVAFINRVKKATGRKDVLPHLEHFLGYGVGSDGLARITDTLLRVELIETLWPSLLLTKRQQGVNTISEHLKIGVINTYRELGKADRGEELLRQVASLESHPEWTPLRLPRAATFANLLRYPLNQRRETNAAGTGTNSSRGLQPAVLPISTLDANAPAPARTNAPLARLIASTDPAVLDFSSISNRWGQAQLELLAAKAEEGVAEAQSFLAWRTESGKGLQTNKTVAAIWYQRAAEQGLAAAQRRLAWLYQGGIGVTKDHELALHWMRKAAEQGLTAAEYGLGWLNEHDSKADPNFGNFQVAAEWYEKAALKNHTEAEYRLGRLYCVGKLPHDHPKAAYWLRLAAAQGHLNAIFELGELLRYNHQDLPADLDEAIRLYRRAAAANHRGALYELGMMFAAGEGLPKDLLEAQRLIEKAAQLGELNAPNELPRIAARLASERALSGSRIEDLPLARVLEAAEQGNRKAQLELARRYEVVEPANPNQSLKWFMKALRNSTADPDQNGRDDIKAKCTGFLLRNPDLEIKEQQDIVDIESLAMDDRTAGAEFAARWGERRLHGRLVPKNIEIAVMIFESAVWKRSPVACLRLGELWDSDQTHNHEPAEAVGWLRLAAELNNAEAQYRLGKAYVDGYGVDSDAVEAWRWLTLSAEQGQADAQKAVVLLTPKLSVEELKKAQALVESFRRQRLQAAAKATP